MAVSKRLRSKVLISHLISRSSREGEASLVSGATVNVRRSLRHDSLVALIIAEACVRCAQPRSHAATDPWVFVQPAQPRWLEACDAHARWQSDCFGVL